MSSSSSSSSKEGSDTPSAAAPPRKKAQDRVSRTSLILWHTHQNDASAVLKLLAEDPDLVNARDYDSRTPLHVASIHGLIDVAECLLDFRADVNAQDRWKNTEGDFWKLITIKPPLNLTDLLGRAQKYIKFEAMSIEKRKVSRYEEPPAWRRQGERKRKRDYSPRGSRPNRRGRSPTYELKNP